MGFNRNQHAGGGEEEAEEDEDEEGLRKISRNTRCRLLYLPLQAIVHDQTLLISQATQLGNLTMDGQNNKKLLWLNGQTKRVVIDGFTTVVKRNIQ